MICTRRELLTFTVACAFTAGVIGSAFAQDFPNKPIKIVVPYQGSARAMIDLMSSQVNTFITTMTRAGGVISLSVLSW